MNFLVLFIVHCLFDMELISTKYDHILLSNAVMI